MVIPQNLCISGDAGQKVEKNFFNILKHIILLICLMF